LKRLNEKQEAPALALVQDDKDKALVE